MKKKRRVFFVFFLFVFFLFLPKNKKEVWAFVGGFLRREKRSPSLPQKSLSKVQEEVESDLTQNEMKRRRDLSEIITSPPLLFHLNTHIHI